MAAAKYRISAMVSTMAKIKNGLIVVSFCDEHNFISTTKIARIYSISRKSY